MLPPNAHFCPRSNRKEDFVREERYFGVNPLAFVDDVYKFVEKYTLDAFDAMELSLANARGFESKQKRDLLTKATCPLASALQIDLLPSDGFC